MLKDKLLRLSIRYKLRLTPVTHEALVALNFNVDKLFYRLTDFNIYVENKTFFYYTDRGKRRTLKNMLQVSDLIYGKVPYLHI